MQFSLVKLRLKTFSKHLSILALERHMKSTRCLFYFFIEMGHLIAVCYGVVVINLSDGKCITFLPLMEHKFGTVSNNALRDIGIGHVNNNHFASRSTCRSILLGSYNRWRQMDGRYGVNICYE